MEHRTDTGGPVPASTVSTTSTTSHHSTPTMERQAELRALFEENRAAQRAPYAGVKLRTQGELHWIMQQHTWSGEQESRQRPDFAGVDLSGVDLTGVVLNGADLSGADLTRATLVRGQFNGASFVDAILAQADLSHSSFNWADFSQADIEHAKFTSAELLGATFRSAVLGQANFHGAYLERADLGDAALAKADLTHAVLTSAKLNNCLLAEVDLSHALLAEADLSGAHLAQANLRSAFCSGANFSQANLAGSNLTQADLSGARLSAANLREAILHGTNLNAADFRAADLRETRMNDATRLDAVQLDRTTKLGDIIWHNVSLIRIDWEQLPSLGDEHLIPLGRKRRGRKRRAPGEKRTDTKRSPGFLRNEEQRRELARCCRDVARAYHGLALVLQLQGLSVPASRFRLKEHQFERKAMFWEGRGGAWLFSYMLDKVAGYGEHFGHALRAYIVVILAFAAADWFVANFLSSMVSHLTWDEALVLSLTSFHGRGFFPGNLSLGDWIARLGACEAVIGLFIELIFLATFSRRFLSD